MHDHHAGDDDCTAGDCAVCGGIGYLPDVIDSPDCEACAGTGWQQLDDDVR